MTISNNNLSGIASNNVRLLNHSIRKSGETIGIIGFKDEKLLEAFENALKGKALKPLNSEVKKVSYGVAKKFIAPTEKTLRNILKAIKKASVEATEKALKEKAEKEAKEAEKAEKAKDKK